MFGESIVTILFRLLNFVALMALFTFIFKKYMKKDIEESIEHDKQDEINMNNHIIEASHRSQELSEEIINQEKLCKYLLDRTDQWHATFDESMQEKKHEKYALQLKEIERTKRQTQAIADEHLRQVVLPKAIAESRAQLTASFAHESKNKAFVHDIISHIKKSS
jgi:GMP synthase PP-ATPase subunit